MPVFFQQEEDRRRADEIIWRARSLREPKSDEELADIFGQMRLGDHLFCYIKDYELSFKKVSPCIIYAGFIYCSTNHNDALEKAGLTAKSFHNEEVECGFFKDGEFFSRKEADKILGYMSTKGMKEK